MQGDETLITYLTRAHGYASALANIGEDIKDKEMVLLVISDLREDCNGLKSTLLAHHPPISFIELHTLLSDHDYKINKTLPTATASQPHTFTASTKAPLRNLNTINNQTFQ